MYISPRLARRKTHSLALVRIWHRSCAHGCPLHCMRPLPLMATLTAAASLSPKPRVLGVTGGIAMGKSTITKLLQTVYRIPFHDADQCVRRLYAKGGPAVAPVAAAFGDVLSEDGAIDRAKLGAKLTHLEGAARTEAFERLDAIVHPLVREERARFVRDQTCWLVGVDIPLLFETGAEGIDHTVAVSCGRDEQRRRALKREGMTPAKLDAILGRQLADEDRVARADFVVETDCYDKARARGQAAGVIEELWGASSLDEAAPCRAVSFDLDNTLWPTWPPIAEAKNALPSLIRAHVPGAAAAFGAEDDDILKGLAAFERDRPVLDVEKDVRHDITARRRVVYRQLAEAYGAPVSHGDALAAAYEDARSEATDAHLDGDALACVASLRAMGVETVGALTNGNAHACGRLGAVLDYWLTAGDVGAAKPRAPPFLAACAQSRCAPSELVHVGDSLADDALGALEFGARAIQVRKYDSGKERDEGEAVRRRLEAYGADRFARVDSVADVPKVIARWR